MESTGLQQSYHVLGQVLVNLLDFAAFHLQFNPERFVFVVLFKFSLLVETVF